MVTYNCSFLSFIAAHELSLYLQSLEVWSMIENQTMSVSAHDGLIAALAQSPTTGMVASASHDKSVKLWK